MPKDINILHLLNPLDWLIFIFVILLTLAFVIWGQSKKNNLETEEQNFVDLMLMGRQLTLPMFVATLVATWYGGIFGVSQIAFENGIYNFVTQGVFWYVSYLIFAFFITKKISQYKAMTLPDLIGQMFGPVAEKISAMFNLLNLIPVAYAISIGLFLKMLLGYELYVCVAIGVGFVLTYSVLGGFRAVVFSDLIQFFVMCTAVISVCFFSFLTYGLAPLKELPASYFDPTGGYSLLQTFSWGLIAISTLVDPNFYQRCFAAKSLKIAKKGILVSTCIWIIFDLSLTIGAMYARAVMPEANSEYGYFVYALQLLPEGMRGFVLAGIAATVLSTLDSYIFLAGSTLAYDLVPKKYKGRVSIHHLGLILVGVFSVFMAYIFKGNIKSVWKTLGSLSSSSLLVPVLMGHLYKRKFTDLHFVTSSLAGAITALSWRLSGMKEYYQLDEIYLGMTASLISFMTVQTILKKE